MASQLNRALFLERTEGNYQKALETYQQIIELPEVEPQQLGRALLGAARCHLELGQPTEAALLWERIISDTDLPVDVREKAEAARGRHSATVTDVDEARLREEALRASLEQRRKKAEALLEQARAAHAQGLLELARDYCMAARNEDPNNEEAMDLLTQILRSLPDRGELLVSFIRFVHTTRIQAFQRLKADVLRLERQGRDAFKASDYAVANEHFRHAISLIDEGEFLGDMLPERGAVLGWLRKTLEQGHAGGLDLGSEPPFPVLSEATPGFRRRLFDLLSELFTARPEEGDPLLIYEVRPAPVTASGPEGGLVAGPFEGGIAVTRRESTLSRARWAERWIRTNIGTGWSATGGRGDGPPRILERFEDLLIVQHAPSVHQQVQGLLEGFSPAPGPVVAHVAVLATTTAGGTRVAAALRARAAARESGFDFVIGTRLWEESLEDVSGLEGVRLLGTVRVNLPGESATMLEFTMRSETHPAYQNLGEPELRVSAEDARYGLWLELFGEDMPQALGVGRSAVSVRAVSHHPLSSVVVPKPHAGGEWMRLPNPMGEQVLEEDRRLPHAGTMIMMGLANPFPASAVTHPDLVLLLGMRPGATGGRPPPIPDPPRTTGMGTTPGGAEEREYALGPLATEVVDQVVLEGWPRQPATLPVPLATLRKAREDYLAERLGIAWAQLAPPGEKTPVVVRGATATVARTPAEHLRVQRAVEAFRAHETTLYEVDVLAVEVAEDRLAEWLLSSGARAFTPGTYLLSDPTGLVNLDQRMRVEEQKESIYGTQSRLLARATEKVVAKQLHAQAIVEDLRPLRTADGRQRYLPVTGMAEEGLVVLVRPELDA
ncbi:MAG: tetratricopeptide repeat protein, partial [Planctomycetota bacterium]